MLSNVRIRVKGMGLALLPLVTLAFGCAVKPAEKVSHGEDRGLISKTALLGWPLGEVAASELILSGKPQKVADLSEGVKPLLASPETKDLKEVSIDVGETYVTIGKVVDGATQPVLQFKIKGHFDLKAASTQDGVTTQYLVRDTAANLRWQDREYVDVDAMDPLKIKASEDTLTHLYDVSTLKDKEFVFASEADLVWMAPSDRAALVALFGLKAGDKLKTTLSRTALTLLKLNADGSADLLAQVPVTYIDLVRDKTDKGELMPDLKRDQAERDWSLRVYVAVDPEAVKLAKLAPDLLHNMYEKRKLEGRLFVLGDSEIPIVSETPDLDAVLARVGTIRAKKGDTVELQAGELSVDVLINGVLALKYPILGHFDVVNATDIEGARTAELVLEAEKIPRTSRKYIQVIPDLVEVARLSDELATSSFQILKKDDLKSCYALADLPTAELKALAEKTGETEVCLDIAQTLMTMLSTSGKVLMTFSVVHFDVKHEVSVDRGEVGRLLNRDITKPNWLDRAYIEFAAYQPDLAETHVREDALKKSALEGEFLYTATVVAAHSENGLLMEGYQLQSTDRLRFEVREDSITAYKVNEVLNQSEAKSPVLRYRADHFNIERLKNGYGDRTHVTAETRDVPWQSRGFLGVDFASNEIDSYFNDLLGVEKLYFGSVYAARSERVGNIKIEDDMISFETEEVLTPNARSGFDGSGETRYEPFAIRVRHNFMRLGARSYVAKEYDRFDFQRFGYFRATEAGLDAERGKTDETLKHFIQRFDVSGDKHIDYYLSPGFPQKYKDEMQDVVDAWNVAFKAATGRDNVIILHGEAEVDHGDPRLNMLVFIDGHSTSSPLGYGPAFFDPISGEHLSAKAYLYGDGIRAVMNSASDYYDLATGRSPTDFMSAGRVLATAAPAARGGSSAARVGTTARSLPHPFTQAMPRRQGVAKAMADAAPRASSSRGLDVLRRLTEVPGLVSETARGPSGQAFARFNEQLKSKAVDAMAATMSDRHQGCVMHPDHHIASAIRFVEAFADKSKAEVLAELESRMVFTTMLHEVGHNLGLRHNFHGSFDETNFPPEYHLIKTLNERGVPDPIMAGEWLLKYRGSSVMEYSDDYEALYKAAGPYDVAAIKYGYGDKLEKVLGVDDTGALVTEDISASELDAKKAEILASDPTVSEVAADAAAARQLGVRSYLFCTDEHVENDPTCQRFDRGVTIAEIAQSLVEDYEVIYTLHGFRRDRRTFMGNSSYVLTRYALPLRQLVDEYLYNLIFDAFRTQDAPDGSPVAGSPADFLAGINIGIDFFDKVLNTLEPGVYHLDDKTGELVLGRQEGGKNVVVDLPDGKYLEAQTETVGNEERVLRRGIEFDKLSVLYVMSMRGFPAEKYYRASLSLNFFDVLKSFTMAKFSSVMRDDLTVDLAAVRTEEGGDFFPLAGVTSVDPADPNALVAKVRPNTNLTLKQYAAIFAMANYNTSSDRTFGDYVSYRIKGVNDALPAGVRALEFTSTSGQTTYVVPNTLDGMSVAFKIAEKAAPLSTQLLEARAQLASAPDLTPLKAAAVEIFAQAWAIGEGAPIDGGIVDLLMGNFEAYIAAMRGIMGDWLVAAADDPVALEQLTALAAVLEERIAGFEGQAASVVDLEDSISELERDLTKHESDLLFLHELNEMLGSL